MKSVLLSCFGLALAAGSAGAITTFSFASDEDSASFTFRGLGSSISDGQDSTDVMILTIDDGNGPAAPITFSTEFQASFTLQHIASVPQGGGFLHTYNLSGASPSFGFYLPGGAPLLTATIANGVMTSLGASGSWGSGGGLSGTDIAGDVTYTWHGPNLPQYGLFTGQSSVGIDDFLFTLSSLRSNGNPGVSLSDNLPSSEWQSEGSFSGSANFVPAPGAAALLGLAGLIARRRR